MKPFVLYLILNSITIFFLFYCNPIIHYANAQTPTNSVVNDTWISKRDNVNITMNLDPKVPIIDQQTKIEFDISKLNNSGIYDNMHAKVTVTDSAGRLFKFPVKDVSDGKFDISYIFPGDGEHRIILQLYVNDTPFTVGSFEVIIPSTPPPTPDSLGSLLSPFAKLFQK